MTQKDILRLASPFEDGTMFRHTIGKVKNLPLSLALIHNDRLIKQEAETIREVLKAKEPAELEKLRAEGKTAEKQEAQEIQSKFNFLYNEFINQPEIQEFLKSENELKLKQCTLDEKYIKAFDSDQIEVLMYFTNVEELIEKMVKEEEKSTEPKKLQKRGK